MNGVKPAESSSKHLYTDSHCCWSQTVSSGTGEGRKSDVNTADWWRTVKLPFVKEKQEASCGRPSLSGWEETAGRKPHLQAPSSFLTIRLDSFALLTSARPLPLFSITNFIVIIKECVFLFFFFFFGHLPQRFLPLIV